ncbi:hypothetical protein [Defluviitalea phaphyphila]|uniref:hypothetical protein n=1 Tax=Defluviitalea phaphyphila TaxID=1473580 RepID=UPI000730EF82|nr:hypothetical protein [Defluviitalea phaphyphila]
MININCSYKCSHQLDGKCTLKTASNVSKYTDENYSIDCPYFENKNIHKKNLSSLKSSLK